MTHTKLVMLGTGTPNLEPKRYQSSLAVIVDDTPYIVDCGGGTLQRISQARSEKGIEALAFDKLTHLFLTHLHPDHTTGVPDFIIAPWVEGRQSTLEITGPIRAKHLVTTLLAAYETGIAEHRDGAAPINHPLDIAVHEIKAGQTIEHKRTIITAIPAQHGNLNAVGYKFASPDKTIVISGDTTPLNSLVDVAKGCDLLVHEVYSERQWRTRPPAWQRYHRQYHTSTRELAKLAQAIQPKLLVLTHQLLWGTTHHALVDEIKQFYGGAVISGRDLDILT